MAVFEVTAPSGKVFQVDTEGRPPDRATSQFSLTDLLGQAGRGVTQAIGGAAQQGVGQPALSRILQLDPTGRGRQTVGRASQVPQAAVETALPIAGGVAGGPGGLPGVSVGAGAGSALANLIGQARRDPGAPPTKRGALAALGLAGRQGAATAAGTAAFGVGAKVVGSITGLAGLTRVTSVAKRNAFVEGIRQKIMDAKTLAGEKIGAAIDDIGIRFPTLRADLSEPLLAAQQKALTNPAFNSLIRSSVRNKQESQLIQSILNQPESATQLTLKEVQMIKGVFQNALKQKFKQATPEFTDAHLDALEIWHQIRLSQLKTFPEFKEISAVYAKAIEAFRKLKPSLSGGPGALEKQLLTGFRSGATGLPPASIIEATKLLLTPQTLRLLKQFRRSGALVKFGIDVPRRTAEIGAIAGLLRFTVFRRGGGGGFGGSEF